jgi:hypothetical protein
MRIAYRPALLVLVLAAALPFAALGADRGELSAQLATATEQVKAIVNQPVASYPADASSQPALLDEALRAEGISSHSCLSA